MTAPLANLARDEHDRRRAYLRQQVASARIAPDKAERMLRPWAALALRAGAVPVTLAGELANRAAEAGERWAKLTLAEDLCPRAEMLAELTRARDAALDALDAPGAPAAQVDNARALCRLATHFCTAPTPTAPLILSLSKGRGRQAA